MLAWAQFWLIEYAWEVSTQIVVCLKASLFLSLSLSLRLSLSLSQTLSLSLSLSEREYFLSYKSKAGLLDKTISKVQTRA